MIVFTLSGSTVNFLTYSSVWNLYFIDLHQHNLIQPLLSAAVQRIHLSTGLSTDLPSATRLLTLLTLLPHIRMPQESESQGFLLRSRDSIHFLKPPQ